MERVGEVVGEAVARDAVVLLPVAPRLAGVLDPLAVTLGEERPDDLESGVL